MKKLFALSIALNVALLGATGMLVSTHFRAEKNQPQLLPERSPDQPTTLPPSSTPPEASAKPFHWSQLEADDYPSYISNLRRIGCPEATIRRLVTSEVHDTYVEKRRELETRMSGHAAPRVLASEIQKMDKEETALLGSVLQPNADPASSSQSNEAAATPVGSDSTSTYAELTARVPRVQPVFMPLAFQIADSEATRAVALEFDSGRWRHITQRRAKERRRNEPPGIRRRYRWRQAGRPRSGVYAPLAEGTVGCGRAAKSPAWRRALQPHADPGSSARVPDCRCTIGWELV